MLVELQFFEQAADRVIRMQEVTVGGARLVLHCEDRAVLARVRPVDDVHGPHAQCDDLLGALEAGEDYGVCKSRAAGLPAVRCRA